VFPCHGLPNQTLAGTLAGLPSKLTTTGRALTSSPNTASRKSVLLTVSVSPVLSVSAVSDRESVADALMPRPYEAALRAASSFDTSTRISSSVLPAMRAAFKAAISCAGQPIQRGPNLTCLGHKPCAMRKLDGRAGISGYGLCVGKTKDCLQHVCTFLVINMLQANYAT